MSDERALTTTEVADRLNVQRRTVERWLREGELEGFQLPGGDWRIWPTALERLAPSAQRGHEDARRVS